MNTKRRVFLRGTLAGSAVAVAVGAGLVTPREVLAAWPQAAFQAKNVDDALTSLMGTTQTQASNSITIKAPDIAENGAVVPITVTADMPGVESITLLAEKNASPLVAGFKMTPKTEGFVSTRIKMGSTSDVIAVVKAGGKTYSARKEIKVTIGGCGG